MTQERAMKEKDIRDHINAFLRSKLQNLVVPASMGLGLMAWGCDDSSLGSNPDGAADASTLGTGGYGAGGIYGFPASGGVPAGGSGGRTVLGGAGGSGGRANTGGFTASGGIYGFAGSGGSGGAGGSGGRTNTGGVSARGGIYGFAGSGGGGGGMAGAGGTVYGTGPFRDAAPADARDAGISEAGVSEANPSEDVSSDGRRDR
jgi:hypothetical protein